TQLVRLLDAGRPAVDALRAYDAVLLGGAAAPGALRERAHQAGVHVVTTYGMTETAGGCVYDGRPLDGVQVDVDHDGHIHLGGDVVFSGYRLRPDLTRRALAVRDGVRWHATHDVGRLDSDGMLTVLGRADDVIVTGAEKVAAGAVEEVLARHPGIRECVVVGRPDREWGERVVAVVVPADPDAPPVADDLRAHVAERLGPGAAPREVVHVRALPLLTSGKVDRATLRDQWDLEDR
ncbi:MAG: AMP-binding enzyme, partial [Actinomycetes bacterium]